ncbi:MAG: LytR family transcriptional regulator [Coriobacteriaceae bacterium]|nr:LytR family transcriptional regulator [Coriobacteriaceae bacterium]
MARTSKQSEAYWENSYQQGSREQHAASSDLGHPSDGQSAASFSRDRYVGQGGAYPAGGAPRKGKLAKRIAIAIVAIIAALVIAVVAYALVFEGKLHGSLSNPEALQEQLTPAAADEPYYILLLGSDWRENSGTSKKAEMSGDQQRADVIILARMDPANKQVTLVSVPRDTRWYHDGTVNKINEAYNAGGAALQTQLVSELTGVPIAHTIETHFSGLEGLVDALGGVEVDVPKDISYKDALTGEKVKVEAGRRVLNGQEAQIFARVRNAYGGVDSARQSNVRTLIMAIADTMREKPLFEWPFLGLKIADCLGTDMSLVDFAKLMKDFGSGGLTIYSGTGPTEGEIDDSAGGIWLCYDNPEGWQAVMEVVDAGGDPSKVDADSYGTRAQSEAVAQYDEYGNYIGDYVEGYADGYVEGYTEDYTGWE